MLHRALRLVTIQDLESVAGSASNVTGLRRTTDNTQTRLTRSRSKLRWQFWIDRGGTFTDIVARRPDGSIMTHKLLSDNPDQYRDAALAGIRRLLGIRGEAPIPPR